MAILEEFSVLETLSNMVTKKKKIKRPNGFEGLLRYYVKLKPIQFIKQCDALPSSLIDSNMV
jgi:hypothetical protein